MADDYEGLERLKIENDYEGGEFYYRSKKELPVQTGEDVIYGTLATAPSDSDSDGGGRRSQKFRKGDLISKAKVEAHTKGIGLKLMKLMG